ncbi:MAG: DEAD/DEAH box helicase [Caldilineaceae bacterium]|nr:DEAD/DEAH box helicase [Caldilineaceae bacterium]
MSLDLLLQDLRRDPSFMTNVTAWQTAPARPPRTQPIPDGLHPLLVSALHRRGIDELYTHQRQAIDAVFEGRHIAVVTPTASGKTLCYNLPVLHQLLADPAATALYLFPTKALAHDQLEEIENWRLGTRDWGSGPDPRSPIPGPRVAAYDGDTPSAARAEIRRTARLLITNPDMLHVGILPYHAAWADFFAGLRAVVIDEMHIYRGVFGSHVANVLRRFQRIAAFYGSHPQFILTSATIANPGQLAGQLIEAPVTVIDENGAPQGKKEIILYNPPLYDPARGLRRSSVLESQDLAVRLLQNGVQTIVFGRSRLTVEVLLTYLRERSRRRGLVTGDKGLGRDVVQPSPISDEPPTPSAQSPITNHQSLIRGYRGGYLPEERRAIEAGLRSGEVRAVVATNALELGIDIGQLEAALICGYPGTIASTWQQMGRAGRTTATSLAILVATAGALDQYIVGHPEYLLEKSPEHAFINPDNLMLLVDQIRCAAFELPFAVGERFGQSIYSADVLTLLAEQGDLRAHGGRYLWQGEGYPARQISLRSAGGDAVVIQSRISDEAVQIIGEIDAASAPMLVHTGAVYIHEGQSHLVDSLDVENRLAMVSRAAVDFYTEASTDTEIEILAIHTSQQTRGAEIYHGDLAITSQVTGYRRVRHYTHETLGSYPLDYPPQTLESSGYWFEVTSAAQEQLILANQWRDAPNDYGPNWAEQRQKVRTRDGFRCTECGAPEPVNSQHDVHHLRPFRTFGYVREINENYREANQLSNLTLLCRRCHQRVEAGVRTRTGLDGLAYALQNLAPLFLMCDRSDIGVWVAREEEGKRQKAKGKGDGEQLPVSGEQLATEERQRSEGASERNYPITNPQSPVPNPQSPRIYIFERIAAGLGFSQQLFENHAQLLASAETLIHGCGCRYGCPACVGPVPLSGESELPLLDTKQLTLALLHVLREESLDPPGSAEIEEEIIF